MVKRTAIISITAKITASICLTALTGCSRPESEIHPEETFHIPTLPDTGDGLMDFVPEGWRLLDSVELDFNEDKIPDYVGVLDADWLKTESGEVLDLIPPRILFAIASDDTGRYHLNFQDINLIRTRGEGGVFGDPYEPLTAEETSFTIHAYGGSAWKWSEKDTYTFYNGVWRSSLSEGTSGYGPYITSYRKNDWEKGMGIRKQRSSEFDDMEKYMDSETSWEEDRFDVEYELSLDEPPTLYQAGMRRDQAADRVTNWQVLAINLSENSKLSEKQVKLPDQAYIDYCDENCVLYTFQDKDSSMNYLAMYHFQDKTIDIVAQSETDIDYPQIYKEKIYYSTDMTKEYVRKKIQDGQEQIVKEEKTTGICLNQINPDGTNKKVIFQYRYPESDQEIPEDYYPYLSLLYEISGDEIIAQVYVGDNPHPVYRMNCDGTGLRQIGQIPASITN